jgi:hypothetical protein
MLSLFRTTSRRAAGARALAALVVVTPPAPLAARGPESLASAVPAEVAEVVTGGTWIDGAMAGTYRVVTVVSGTDRDYGARVYIQWLQVRADTGRSQLIRTVPVAEFNELVMPHAVVTLETEVENRAAVLIAAEDMKAGRSVLISVQAGPPGQYVARPAAKPTD